MRKTIYVIDPVCPQSYDFEVLKKDGLGASESYLLFWINDLLGDNKIHLENTEIIFFQAHRKKTDSILYKENNNKLTFSGLESVLEYEHLDPQTIILQRDPRLYDYCKRIYPEANLILYCHDFFEGSPFFFEKAIIHLFLVHSYSLLERSFINSLSKFSLKAISIIP